MLLVTKHLAELCTLAIDDVYGELPSRIFAALLNRGRATLPQLVQYTSLSARQVRHGLAVLLQHDLLFYSTAGTDKTTHYEANPQAAYNLLRTGRVLEAVERQHGGGARDAMQSLFALGHTRIADLKEAYRQRIQKWESSASNGANGTNGHDHGHDHTPEIQSLKQLNAVLCTLVAADLLEVVAPSSFACFADRDREVRERIEATYYPDGVRGGKKKDEYETRVADELAALRDEPRKLKRSLAANGSGVASSKRRRLVAGGFAHGAAPDDDDDDDNNNNPYAHAPPLDPNTVLRVNHDKCAVELRNDRLAEAAAAAIGETTAQVYLALLRQITADVPRCRADAAMDMPGGAFFRQRAVATSDVYDALDPTLDVFAGIGKARPEEVDVPTAERLQRHAPMDVAVEEEEDDEEDEDYDSEGEDLAHGANGNKSNGNGRVTFDGTAGSEDARMQQMRQHLLLLCDHKLRFVRHCERGAWTVDFAPLLRRLREAELDCAIERRVGRQGLRLARILRDKGKLDEKTLPAMALMKKGDVQNKMLEMQMLGLVEMQEVPRDNNRSATRTLFLWYCDTPRALDMLLDNTYKTMVRCLRVRDVHRQASSEVLAFVQRPDIKGREQESLEKKYYDKYQRYCAVEQKVLGQVGRLDSLVATLRDY